MAAEEPRVAQMDDFAALRKLKAMADEGHEQAMVLYADLASGRLSYIDFQYVVVARTCVLFMSLATSISASLSRSHLSLFAIALIAQRGRHSTRARDRVQAANDVRVLPAECAVR